MKTIKLYDHRIFLDANPNFTGTILIMFDYRNTTCPLYFINGKKVYAKEFKKIEERWKKLEKVLKQIEEQK